MAVTKRTRYEVLRRDNHTCRYCGATAPDAEITVDHVVPKSLGGGDDPSNLVAACRDCNSGKASASPEDVFVANVSDEALAVVAAMERRAADRATQVRKMRDVVIEVHNRWIWEQTPDDFYDTVARFYELGLDGVILNHTMDRACNPDVRRTVRHTWLWFCKVCWAEVGKIRDGEPTPPPPEPKVVRETFLPRADQVTYDPDYGTVSIFDDAGIAHTYTVSTPPWFEDENDGIDHNTGLPI